MTEITRRSFLTGLAGVLVAAVVPQILIPKHGTSFAGNRIKGGIILPTSSFVFKGSRYPSYFSRIVSGERDLSALREYDYDIRQVLLTDNKPKPEDLIKPVTQFDPEILVKWNDGKLLDTHPRWLAAMAGTI